MTNFFIPPDDPQIVALKSIPGWGASNRIVKHVKKHGFTYPSDIARKLGLPMNTVYRTCEHLGLSKRRTHMSYAKYFRERGYATGKLDDLGPEVIGWIVGHCTGSDSLMQTVAKLLSGNAKPNPTCGCSLCLRGGERPDHE